jgi:hypothetical protein
MLWLHALIDSLSTAPVPDNVRYGAAYPNARRPETRSSLRPNQSLVLFDSEWCSWRCRSFETWVRLVVLLVFIYDELSTNTAQRFDTYQTFPLTAPPFSSLTTISVRYIEMFSRAMPWPGWLGCLPLDARLVSSDPAKGDGFLRAIKIHSTTSSGREVELSVPCRKFLWHVKEPYEYESDTL